MNDSGVHMTGVLDNTRKFRQNFEFLMFIKNNYANGFSIFLNFRKNNIRRTLY